MYGNEQLEDLAAKQKMVETKTELKKAEYWTLVHYTLKCVTLLSGFQVLKHLHAWKRLDFM